MSLRKRLALCVAFSLLFTTLWTARGAAQIWHPYPYPPYRYAGAEGSVRIEVTPREAEVYVDGYYAGNVDDFDGAFQRLHIEPGEHEITIYRDGFRAITQRIYVQPNRTFKIKERMSPLQPGDVAEPRPAPANPPVGARSGPPGQPGLGRVPAGPGPGGPGGRRPPAPNAPLPPPREEGGAPPPEESATGTLAIRVQPSDAEIVVDGQPWRVPGGADRLLIDASEGRHNIQVRKAGYVGYLTDVQVRRGETTLVNVNLRAAP